MVFGKKRPLSLDQSAGIIVTKNVIPAKAEIQEKTGFRVKPGMTNCTILMLFGLICLPLFTACKEKAPPPPPPPPKVTVAQPRQQAVTDSLDLTGNTQAIYTVQLVARVAGYLEMVFFQDGQLVRQGQSLFRIQQDAYQDAVRQAEGQVALQRAQLDYAEKQLARYSNLLQQKATSQENVDNWRYQRDSGQANLKVAEAALDLAKLNLSYTHVTAPFDGRIDRRLQDPGNLVGAGENTILAHLNQIDPIYVYFNISDADLARLMTEAQWQPGQTPSAEWPIFAGFLSEKEYPHQGRLDFASISLTSTTGTLLMRGVFPNPDGRILPGLYARVRVPVKKKTGLLVPQVAVASDQQGSYVLTVNDKGVVERRSVNLGPTVGNLQVIEEGLRGKEWVIVNGLLRAGPGRQVTAEREATGPPPPTPPQAPRQGKAKP